MTEEKLDHLNFKKTEFIDRTKPFIKMSASKLFMKKGTGNFGMRDMLFTEDEYREALKRFLEICDAPAGSEEAEELEHLMVIMEVYERDNCS